MEQRESALDLGELRDEIDKADQMILSSFIARMRVVRKIAEYKKENGMAVLDPEREKEKIEEIRRISPDDMEDSCVMLYNKIMEISRDFQTKEISE